MMAYGDMNGQRMMAQALRQPQGGLTGAGPAMQPTANLGGMQSMQLQQDPNVMGMQFGQPQGPGMAPPGFQPRGPGMPGQPAPTLPGWGGPTRPGFGPPPMQPGPGFTPPGWTPAQGAPGQIQRPGMAPTAPRGMVPSRPGLPRG